jgi:cation-transporting ATPase 13A3/4/5
MAFLYTIVVVSGGLSVAFFKYRNEVTLYKLTHVTGTAEVYRDSKYITISQKEIVPGDVIVLKPGVTYCDMVVLYDTHLVVDESALTGESTPVSKSAIDLADKNSLYRPTSHKKNTIFAGTSIIESSETETDLALVTKTGSFTSKGEMLREILAYERHHFKFDTEVQIVIIILFFYATVGFAIVMNLIKMSHIYGWFYGMYVFAAALPPLLPTVFVVSVGISDECLSRKNIACSNSESILVAGKVRKALFDKTGTLTKQGLDFLSARGNAEWNYQVLSQYPSGDLATGMACCNTLSLSNDGSVIGNTVDKIMFQASGSTLSYRNNSISVKERSGRTVSVVKRYEFDHHRMTQSVIVDLPGGKTVAFVKGSAESIRSICRPETLPDDYDNVVKHCSSEGIYQLSMGYKELVKSKYVDIPRDTIERSLDFLGVVNFKNMLREETPSMIEQLKEGDIESIMVTGDSLLTGIHIAKECGILFPDQKVYLSTSMLTAGTAAWIDESENVVHLPPLQDLKYHPDIALCVSGTVWSSILQNNREDALQLVEHIRVYGRCTPNDKVSVVSAFIDKGFITSMCGDGGNDCGALKTAHVGIALSDAEASIVSPFTSLDKSILSITEVLKEGRCALASAFASYKYMIMVRQEGKFCFTEAVNGSYVCF